MKRLTNEEVSTIIAAATALTKIQDEDPDYVIVAHDLWEIYKRHNTPEREKVLYKIHRAKYPNL